MWYGPAIGRRLIERQLNHSKRNLNAPRRRNVTIYSKRKNYGRFAEFRGCGSRDTARDMLFGEFCAIAAAGTAAGSTIRSTIGPTV